MIVNPSSLKRDQYQISLHSINMQSWVKVVRIKKVITEEKFHWMKHIDSVVPTSTKENAGASKENL